MQVAHLTEYGVPRIVVDSWRERLGEELLPVQKKAVVEYQILAGQSVLISAPTSSGKTFCGELAAVAAVFRRKKALFVVPLKSIAEERYVEFRARYGGMGIRVAISTADRHEHDSDLEQGRFDIGILVYEKFNQLLVKNIDLLASVDLLLIDEVQMISEPERGWCLELALLKVLNYGYQPQIIALSAVLQDAAPLARWLGCKLLVDHSRPVELRQGVLCDGSLRYRDFNSGDENHEQLSDCVSDDATEMLLANIELLVNRGEQVLAFLKTKRSCEQLAVALAERNFWNPAMTAQARIRTETESVLGERLQQTLQTAVAFHHADLSSVQRRILEESFRTGEIRVMVSTTTPAMGVNLPAQTVFIDCYKYQIGSRSGRPLVVPLSWSEYEGMSGRAGRYGVSSSPGTLTPNPSPTGRGEQAFGRSVLIAQSRAEAETLWQTYVTGKPEMPQSRLSVKSLYDIILDLISARSANRVEAIDRLLQGSLHCLQGGSFNTDVTAAVLSKLAELKLVFVKEGQVEASPIGMLISRHGVGVVSGMMMVSFCRGYQAADRLSWLYFALSLPDAKALPVYLTRDEEADCRYRRRLCEYVASHATVSEELRKMTANDYVLSSEQKVRLKAAFLLLDWISEKASCEIEQDYCTNVGSILQVAETIAWLLETAAGVALLTNRPAELAGQLRQLAGAIERGFDLADTDLPAAGFNGEQRDLAWRLFRSGLTSAENLCRGNFALMVPIVGEQSAKRIIEIFEKRQETSNKSLQEDTMSQLRLRGLMRGDRVYFSFKNKEIDITPKSYNYLYKLTVARFLKPEGWLSKDEIEPGFNQAKNIYRVKQELKRFSTGLEQRIENNGSGFYRINIEPEQIKIDVDSMKSFGDLELAELTKQIEGQRVCQ